MQRLNQELSMLYLKNKISGIKNVLGIYTESTPKPYLIISVMVILGVSVALFESIGLSMLIPVLQKIIDGVDNNISIPIAWLSPMENWLNKWQGYRQLFLIISLIVISGLFKAVLMLINKVASEAISLRIGNYWSEKLFKSILLADISKTLKHKTGHLQNSLVVECGRLRFIFRGMLQIFTALVMGLFYVLLLLTISVKLTVAVGLIFSIFSIPISRLIKHIRQTSFNRTEARSKVGAVIIEILSSLKIVHIFKTFDFELERFKHSINDVLYKELQMVKKSAFVELINQLIGILVPLLIVSFGLFISYRSSAQAKPLWIILFIAVFSRMLPIVQQMFNSMALISRFYGSLIVIKKQIQSFSGHHLENGNIKLKECPRQISMQHVSFGYDKNIAAVEDISLTIDKGESIAFVGPSGSGKSTLIGLIARLFDPNSGDIFLDSINLRDIDINSWRVFIGLVDQNAILFNESIKFNISYGLEDISENEIIDAAKMANAHEFIVNFPKGYESKAGNLGNALSGGQRQRIAIARAIIRDPDILILDEATSSIDSESEDMINNTIEQLKNNGKTIISIAHRLSSIKNVDRLFFVEDNKIKAQGSFDNLIKNNKTFAKYVKLQTFDTV